MNERGGNGKVRNVRDGKGKGWEWKGKGLDRRQEREGWEGGTKGMGGTGERNRNGGRI